MSLYQILFDGDSQWVEAKSYGEAVALWLDAMKEVWGIDDWDGDEEPESCILAHRGDVIRKSAHPKDRERLKLLVEALEAARGELSTELNLSNFTELEVAQLNAESIKAVGIIDAALGIIDGGLARERALAKRLLDEVDDG